MFHLCFPQLTLQRSYFAHDGRVFDSVKRLTAISKLADTEVMMMAANDGGSEGDRGSGVDGGGDRGSGVDGGGDKDSGVDGGGDKVALVVIVMMGVTLVMMVMMGVAWCNKGASQQAVNSIEKWTQPKKK